MPELAARPARPAWRSCARRARGSRAASRTGRTPRRADAVRWSAAAEVDQTARERARALVVGVVDVRGGLVDDRPSRPRPRAAPSRGPRRPGSVNGCCSQALRRTHEAALLNSSLVGRPRATTCAGSVPNVSASRCTSRNGAPGPGHLAARRRRPRRGSANGAVMRATHCSSSGIACADRIRMSSPVDLVDADVERLRVVEVLGRHLVDARAVGAGDRERVVGRAAVEHEHVELVLGRWSASVSRQRPISSLSLSVRMTTPTVRHDAGAPRRSATPSR